MATLMSLSSLSPRASSSAAILGILEHWTQETEKDDERRLQQELERATELHLTRYLVKLDASRPGAAAFPNIAALPNFVGFTKALQQRRYLQLESLILSDTFIDEVDVIELAKAIETGNVMNLQVLKLANCGIRAPSAKVLAGVLESGKMSCIHTLHLENNDIGDVGLISVAGALGSGHVPALKSLYLGAKTEGFHAEGAEALGKAFQTGHMLLLEDLLLQRISEEKGVLSIMRAMEKTSMVVRTFKSLGLWGCQIGLEGARAIASALLSPHFSSLRSLDLSFNKMGDEGVLALSGALKSASLNNLQILSLNNVAMGEKGLVEAAGLLEDGYLQGLHKLSAMASRNTQTSAQALIRAYRNNTFLVAEIQVDWPTKTMENNAERFLKRNEKLVELLKD